MAQLYEAIVNSFPFNNLTLQYGDANLFYFSSGGKSSINEKITTLLDASREQFEVGFPDAGVPPLDPFYLEQFDFYVYQKAVIKATVDFYDIHIAGLKQFVIEDLNFKVVGLTLSFEFTLPQLVITAIYKVDGKVAGFIPFKPSGDARIEVNNVNVKGVAALGVSDGYLNLKSFTGEFDLNKIKIYMSGLIGDGLINNLLNWVLSKIGTNVIQEQRDSLAHSASGYISQVANDLLQNIKLTDLIG